MFKLLKSLEREDQGKAAGKQLARTVLWGFFGVRKRGDLERDAASLSPLQVIIAGLIGAAVFITVLVVIVHLVVP